MKYLKIFEKFNDEFPDVFNGSLRRGVKIDKDGIPHELIKMSKEEGETLQVWTESPCLHKKVI